MSRQILNWLLVIFWMSVIFSFSARPSIVASEIDVFDFIIKKTAHLSEFAILFLLLKNAFPINSANRALLFSVAFAFSDEIHQIYTPGRGAVLRDVFIDGSSIVFAYLLVNNYLSRCRSIFRKIFKKLQH